MIDAAMVLIQKILVDGLSWGAAITAVILWRKQIRNKRLNDRDRYWNALLEAMAEKAGVTWDASLKALQSSATRPSGSFGSLTRTFARSVPDRKGYPSTTNYNSRGKQSMKDYLKKLGKTKFQAYMLVTIVNLVTLIAYLSGNLNIDDQLNQYMPVFNLVVQTLATFIYQWVEGSIDREAQKQQVYIMPGSAAEPFANGPKVEDIPWTEVIARVKAVNSDLNQYIDYFDKANKDSTGRPQFSDVGKEAIARYLQIHRFLNEKGPLPMEQAPKGEESV